MSVMRLRDGAGVAPASSRHLPPPLLPVITRVQNCVLMSSPVSALHPMEGAGMSGLPPCTDIIWLRRFGVDFDARLYDDAISNIMPSLENLREKSC